VFRFVLLNSNNNNMISHLSEDGWRSLRIATEGTQAMSCPLKVEQDWGWYTVQVWAGKLEALQSSSRNAHGLWMMCTEGRMLLLLVARGHTDPCRASTGYGLVFQLRSEIFKVCLWFPSSGVCSLVVFVHWEVGGNCHHSEDWILLYFPS
jgi:hypothetical protein